MMGDSERTMRVLNALGSGAAFTAVSVLVLSLATAKDVGHKVLLWVVFFASSIRAVANFVGAWQVYFHGTLTWDVWLYLVTAISSCLMAGMAINAHADLLTTLRTSEAEDRIRADRAADLQMARWNLEYISLNLNVKSTELLERQRAGLQS